MAGSDVALLPAHILRFRAAQTPAIWRRGSWSDVQAVNDLHRLEVAAESHGERFNVAYIGSDFDFPYKGSFSAHYMHQLSRYSYNMAKDGTPWHRTLRD